MSNPFSAENVEVLADWLAILSNGCCCSMPTCPTITQECQTLRGGAVSAGFRNPDDEVWTRYKKYLFTTVISTAASTTVPHPSGTGTYVGQTSNGGGFESYGDEVDRLFTGSTGPGESCTSWTSNTTVACDAGGAVVRIDYSVFATGTFPDYTYHIKETNKNVTTIAKVSGDETDEHIAWAADVDAWETDHPSGPTWQEATATWQEWDTVNTTYTNWASDRDAWVAEDPENRIPGDYEVPEPPAAGVEPDNPGIGEEPPETYGPCTYRATNAHTVTEYTFDPDTTTPTVTTTHEITTNPLSNLTALMSGDDTDTTSVNHYTGPQSYETWFSEVKGTLEAQLTFPKDACLRTPDCRSLLFGAEAPAAPGIDGNINIQKTRFRWVIASQIVLGPVTELGPTPDPVDWWRGTYFKVTWDVLQEPDGWGATIDDPDYVPPGVEPEGGFPPVPQVADTSKPAGASAITTSAISPSNNPP